MGVWTRAVRNISRRKIRALLVIIALGFCMAIMVSIPSGVIANQESTEALTQNLGSAITQTEASINQTLTQIDCSLSPSMEGFGFTPPDSGSSGFTPSQSGSSSFTPGQFGGGMRPGEFGGGSFGIGGTTPMNESLYSDISSIDGVAAVAPILQVSEGQNQTITAPNGRTFTRLVPDYVIEGIPLTSDLVENYPILPSNITAGRNLQAGDSGVVLLSENNTAFFGVGVGDTVTILDQEFTVIGVHGSSGVSDRTTLYMNLSDAQSLTNNTGYITRLYVFANDSSIVTDVANAISSLHPELTVNTAQQRLAQLQALQSSYNTALENAEASISQTQATAFEEIIVVVAATSLIVLFVMLYTVRERTKEIGTLKAIGFSNWTVMSQFMLEGVLISLIAGVVGIAIATVAAPMFSSLLLPTVNPFGSTFAGRNFGTSATSNLTAVTVDPQLMLMAFGAAVLLGALGTLYPAWRAAKIRPAEAMRYE
ncbi:MAG: FtsX-like permease family protein [Candidatus Bathyarchaeota archaeon]|nr:FtsX-like permease family protein [Candidatus Bathyarchaeota archaeon]